MKPLIAGIASIAAALTLIAAASPDPDRVTDRGTYEAVAAQVIVPDCNDLHCFRVLVPWVLGRLPGPSLLRWKAYAVTANAAAAAAVFFLSLTFGLTRAGAACAAALSAFGFGSLYTLYDCYTADPLMFAVGPLLTNELLRGRAFVVAAVAALGVLAKEFAAAPVYAYAAAAAFERRWVESTRAFVSANFAFIVWLLLTLTLMLRFNYSYGGNESANLTGGSGIGPWLQRQSARGVLSAMFDEFGMLYVLAPVGLIVAPRPLKQLAAASLPVAIVWCYAQQPDRALWNFHFLVTPLAALVLERVPAPLAWATIATFAIGNLRVGAQLPMAGVAHAAIAASVVAAAASAALFARSNDETAAVRAGR